MRRLKQRRVNPVELVLRAMPEDGQCKTPDMVAKETGLDIEYVRDKLRDLKEMGLARRYKSRLCYWLTEAGIERRNACTVDNPIVKLDAPKKNLKHPELREELSRIWLFRQRLWNAMRIQKNFDRDSLIGAASRPEDTWPVHYTNAYLKVLERYGIILRIKAVKQFPRYRLMEDLGPQVPYWNNRSKKLYDRNAEAYIPLPDQAVPA
jgi:hypothetical protein